MTGLWKARLVPGSSLPLARPLAELIPPAASPRLNDPMMQLSIFCSQIAMPAVCEPFQLCHPRICKNVFLLKFPKYWVNLGHHALANKMGSAKRYYLLKNDVNMLVIQLVVIYKCYKLSNEFIMQNILITLFLSLRID